MKRKMTIAGLWVTLIGTACANGGPALERLRAEADKALKAKPHSVMEKARMPPSGDKHDYLSLAPYSWPDPAKADGLPWINRDGQVNPESREGTDSGALGRLCSDVETLALAYRLTQQEPYAAKAATLLRVWFLDPATRPRVCGFAAQGGNRLPRAEIRGADPERRPRVGPLPVALAAPLGVCNDTGT